MRSLGCAELLILSSPSPSSRSSLSTFDGGRAAGSPSSLSISSSSTMLVALVVAFLAGFLCLALIQACAVFLFIKRVLHRHRSFNSAPSLSLVTDSDTSSHPHIFLKGDIWVAAPPSQPLLSGNGSAKVSAPKDKASREYRRKKDSFDDSPEVCPIRRRARLEDNILTLTSDDGLEEHLDMTQCSVAAVSGGKEASGKWAKKYPIKLESQDHELFAGSHICLLYFETGWEKETWCQVLRAASRWDSDVEDWYYIQKKEFHEYSLRLNKAYPEFLNVTSNRGIHSKDEQGMLAKADPVLSRKQKLFKKLAKLSSSRGHMNMFKGSSEQGDFKRNLLESKSVSVHQETNIQAPLLPHRVQADDSSQHEATSSSVPVKVEKVLTEEKRSLSDSQQSLEHVLEAGPQVDQGNMSWNLLFSRLFFDSYHSMKFQEACQRLIQRQLSKIITPGYIGAINCTRFELGTLPPFFHSMQIIPKESDYVWSFEAGLEYLGGAQIKVVTRLDANDYMSQQMLEEHEPTLSEAAAADILRKSLENIEKTVELEGELGNDFKSNRVSSSNAQSKGGWKGVLSRVADSVSQVPITLSLRVVSLRGTLRLKIKPPPTDRIWFGFTSMPSIDIQSEPFVGDYKITTGPLVAYISNKIKTLIQDSLVLPNCESVWVPWMIAEKDDWIQRSVMPVPWLRSNSRDSLPAEEAQTLNGSSKPLKPKETKRNSSTGKTDALDGGMLSSSLPILSTSTESLTELERPALLENHEVPSMSDSGRPVLSNAVEATPSTPLLKRSGNEPEEERGNRSSRRGKVFNLGKKVGEKLDEKRRVMFEKVREGFERQEQTGR